MPEPYQRQREVNQNVSGNLRVAAATTTTTLATNTDTLQQIFLQKLHIEITTGAAQTWTFRDTAGTPIELVPAISVASIAHFDFDFGPYGVPLTLGKNLELLISAAGAVGWVSWEAYQKRTAVGVA